MREHRHDRLLVLDIETSLDEALAPREHPPGEFAKASLHKVLAISFVEARIERSAGSEAFLIEDCRSGGEAVHDERRLLAGFWRFFAARRPRLVTWNGRAHDTAALRLRAMMHGVGVSCWSERPNGRGGYQYRYAADWHCDLADQFADYGASLRLSLQEAAAAFGLPGKIASGAGTVESLALEGRFDDIRSYCEVDACNTFAIYLHWARSTGLSSEIDFRRAVEAFKTYLRGARSDRPHLGTFLDRWTGAGSEGASTRTLAVVGALASGHAAIASQGKDASGRGEPELRPP